MNSKDKNQSRTKMYSKYMSLCLLLILGMAFLATTSLADHHHHHHHHHDHGHHPPKKQWPTTTQNEPSKVEEDKDLTKVEDGHYKPPPKKSPWKKHPPLGN
ncbi:unnamed protein product [Sphenostylis stenocarpa]|uniref:Uncharacterized protein n=1 Tax=Sphenostylis stenocarpa TaxID=92480 RepID=A0AA86SMS3_9FABA|nr:unnamed protein product [Sphenostylis stenocarpa]